MKHWVCQRSQLLNRIFENLSNSNLSFHTKALKTDHIDLYLIHAPYGFAEDTAELFPCDENKSMIFSDIDFLETWQEMEKLVDKGVAQFTAKVLSLIWQLDRALPTCMNLVFLFNKAWSRAWGFLTLMPLKPQGFWMPVESSQWPTRLNVTHISITKSCGNFPRKKVEDIFVSLTICNPGSGNLQNVSFLYCFFTGIVLTAYAPLGSPGKPWESGVPNLMSDPVVASVAEKHSKTPAQVLIRFAVERGIIVVPKSTNPERIAQNFQVFDFSLDLDDINKLMSLNGKDGAGRMFAFENCKDHPHYPFHDEY